MKSQEEVLVSVTGLNRRGWGVSTPSKMEVVGGVPGDTLKVKLQKKKRSTWHATLLEVMTPSPLRVPLRCAHAPSCGGCSWQQIQYQEQLLEKERRVKTLFPSIPCEPIVACQDPWGYRNKMEFSFSQNRAGDFFLGLILAGTRGHVFNLIECHLVSPWYAALLKEVRTWWQNSSLLAYKMDNTGSLRTLIVREGKRTGDKLVFLTVSGNPDYALNPVQLHTFIEAVKASVPDKSALSIFLRIQQIHKGSPTQFFEMHLFGKDHLLEKLSLSRDFFFKISPTSFFQPNTAQAEVLYKVAFSKVSWPKKHVLDLYAGTSTLGIIAASMAERVTSIEINPHACFDAESNKELNGLSNLEILCGDVGEKLQELMNRLDFTPPDLILLDPPRTGLDSIALTHLKTLSSPEILYISCNPETQAANVQELIAFGYCIKKLQPIDQFPHTPHIENIVLLSLSP